MKNLQRQIWGLILNLLKHTLRKLQAPFCAFVRSIQIEPFAFPTITTTLSFAVTDLFPPRLFEGSKD